jgi:carbonic anhydrase
MTKKGSLMRKLSYLMLTLLPILCTSILFGKITSEDALKRLIEGNKRYANDKSTCDDRNNERRVALVSKQNPFATILGCSDSRVPLEIVFDQGVGDLFVVRVAGNIADLSVLESIEYSIKHVNSSIILVLGHENCGAVTAVVKNEAKDIPQIASFIEPAIRSLQNNDNVIETAIKANVRQVVETLKSSKYLKPLLEERKVDVLGGYYHLESGVVEILENAAPNTPASPLKQTLDTCKTHGQCLKPSGK